MDIALDVFRLIRRRLRARFVLVGDGPVRADIERRVAEYGLTDDVEFAGEQQDIIRGCRQRICFCCPRDQESFGLAALEAMACGVPVVASNVGGLPEIIEDGVTGFVCPPHAVEKMAERGDRRADRSRTSQDDRRPRGRHRADRYCTERIVPVVRSRRTRRCWNGLGNRDWGSGIRDQGLGIRDSDYASHSF